MGIIPNDKINNFPLDIQLPDSYNINEESSIDNDDIYNLYNPEEIFFRNDIIFKSSEDYLEFKKNFMKVYECKKPKPSKEILNWIKIRDYAMKQRKFDKVEEANKEINKLQKKDNQKFEKEKENKLILEINKINHRHENENKFKNE